MPVHRIDHITLNASDLAKSCAFYADGLGFEVQRMEGRGLSGAWLKLGGHPFVHLISRPSDQTSETCGLVDHFALEATDLAATRLRLRQAGVAYRENPIPEFDLHQIIVRDPDGVKVELNFRGVASQA